MYILLAFVLNLTVFPCGDGRLLDNPLLYKFPLDDSLGNRSFSCAGLGSGFFGWIEEGLILLGAEVQYLPIVFSLTYCTGLAIIYGNIITLHIILNICILINDNLHED